MRAARFYGKEDIRVEDIQEPICKEGHVKLKPAFVGICGTGTYTADGKPLIMSDLIALSYESYLTLRQRDLP